MTADSNFAGFLTIVSTVFFGFSAIAKKKACTRISAQPKSADGNNYPCWKEPMFWKGLGLLVISEILRGVAYARASALLVTGLWVMSVPITYVLSAIFLKESFSNLREMGCILCIMGGIVVVGHTPDTLGCVNTLTQLHERFTDPVTVVYCVVVLWFALVLIYLSSTMGVSGVPSNSRTLSSIAAAIGSLYVIAIKGYSVATMDHFVNGQAIFTKPITYFLVIAHFTFCAVQFMYLNKALDAHNVASTSSIYYVLSTTFTLAGTAIVYGEWGTMDLTSTTATLGGYCIILGGVLILHADSKHRQPQTLCSGFSDGMVQTPRHVKSQSDLEKV